MVSFHKTMEFYHHKWQLNVEAMSRKNKQRGTESATNKSRHSFNISYIEYAVFDVDTVVDVYCCGSLGDCLTFISCPITDYSLCSTLQIA